MRGSTRQSEGPALIASFINNTINDFNYMTNLLKNQSQSASEVPPLTFRLTTISKINYCLPIRLNPRLSSKKYSPIT